MEMWTLWLNAMHGLLEILSTKMGLGSGFGALVI